MNVYGSLGLPFWPALGNHDYLGDPGAEVGWSVPPGTPTTWNMPSRYYARDVGPARLIAMDTNGLGPAQKRWLKATLAAPFGAFAPAGTAPAPAAPPLPEALPPAASGAAVLIGVAISDGIIFRAAICAGKSGILSGRLAMPNL